MIRKEQRQYDNRLIQDMRPYILDALKSVYGDSCQGCGSIERYYEIDHKRYGGDITIHDLQLLCTPCHESKTDSARTSHIMKQPHCSSCTCYVS